MAVALGGQPLGERLAKAIGRDRDFAPAAGAADIIVTDMARLGEIATTAAIVLLGDPPPDGMPASVHAILPKEADARTIIEAVRLVSHGLLILPELGLPGRRRRWSPDRRKH